MSRESIEWLNNNVLMGYTGDREKWATQDFAIAGQDADGADSFKPWFATEDYTGGFDGPVPVDAVMSRLFAWQAIEGPLSARVLTGDALVNADGIDAEGRTYRNVMLPEHKAIMRSDNDFIMGVFKAGYTVHQYDAWLVENVANILDDDVCIDSAGLLMGGGVAWVSVSLPEAFSASSGFAVRPRILAYTSHNGKHSTTYMRSVNAPVCDNSLDVEVSGADHGKRVKIKHSSLSLNRIGTARDALGILYQQTEETLAFFDALAQWEVTNKQFKALLDRLEPMPAAQVVDGKVKNQRTLTIAQQRREAVARLYVQDHRAAPWAGTALGALQAFNTFDQQERAVNGERVERQMLGTLDGTVAKFDAIVLSSLAELCDVDMGTLVAA